MAVACHWIYEELSVKTHAFICLYSMHTNACKAMCVFYYIQISTYTYL